MIHSMTGYAATQGDLAPWRWSCELRSVNGKGLDLRLRVPDWIDGLERDIRAALAGKVARGNVSMSLRAARNSDDTALTLNSAQLDTVLQALAETETRAMAAGISLAPSTASGILSLRGVMDAASEPDDTSALKTAILTALPGVIAEFNAMRAHEGTALAQVLSDQLTEIDSLTAEATALLETRQSEMADNFQRNVAKVMQSGAEVDPDRLAQELALIAVKSDVAEELDRLRTHIAAARELLTGGGAVGRKLDFLMQEFNREANTLCSKAQMSALTQIGLAMKVTIDQMREQVQNVE